jgi:hypothetical protein
MLPPRYMLDRMGVRSHLPTACFSPAPARWGYGGSRSQGDAAHAPVIAIREKQGRRMSPAFFIQVL